MKYLRLLLLSLIFMSSSLVWAGRVLPNDIHIVVLKKTEGRQVVVGTATKAWLRTLGLGLVKGNKTLLLSRTVRIHDKNNRFVTYNNLFRFVDETIAVRVDRANQIQEIWVLTDEEQDALVRPNNPQVE